MPNTTPAPLSDAKPRPDKKRQILGTIQLVLSLIGFVGLGAIGGAYWATAQYERQLDVIREDNQREVEYISRMLEMLIYQTAENAGRTAKNAVKISKVTTDAQTALNKAQEIMARTSRAKSAPGPARPPAAAQPTQLAPPGYTGSPISPPTLPPAAGEHNPGGAR